MNAHIVIGKIVKPQGIKGEVKVIPLTDDSARFKSLRNVIIDGVTYGVKSCRVTGEAVFMLLENITDRNAAELLRNKDVIVRREDAVKLPEGRHFIVDLIGCSVQTDEATVGKLVEVLAYKTEVYRVRCEDGRYLLFPTADGLILSTDVEGGVIRVDAKRLREVSVYED